MKKILYIATADIRKRTGGGLACLAYYNAFKNIFPGQVDLAMAEEFCMGDYSSAIRIPARSRLTKVIALCRGEIHRYKSFFKQFVKQTSGQYSHCVINGGVNAGDMIDIFHAESIKVIVIHHNFEREYHIDNKTSVTFYGLNSYFINKNEQNAYLKSDANCFLTLSDMELFHTYYGDSSAKENLLGTFEPEKVEFITTDGIDYKHKNIVITGSMDSFQTIDGLMDFKEKYFPVILNKFKNWNIIIAGRNPSMEICQFATDNPDRVKIIVNPENMDEVVDMGAIFLCPTRIGGGLKLRIMDGLRKGLPVITHKVSARGYDVFFDSPFFKIYDDEDSFYNAFVLITDYVEKNKSNRQAIKNEYKDYFSFESGCKRLISLINEMGVSTEK